MAAAEEIISFGYWVRRRRKMLDLTQDALAQQVGCAVATIKKIEGDERRPSRQMAERLAECLQIPADERDSFLRVARAEISMLRFANPPQIESTAVPPAATSAPPSATQHSNNLPISTTNFIGRVTEGEELISLLSQSEVGAFPRMVTLTGPGGIGKTRLSLQVAHALVERTGIESWFVTLAPVRDANLVVSTIAQTLGLHAPAQQNTLDFLKEQLRQRQMLLLLDNFEHLLDAVPQIYELLTAAPGLKILATSRAPLRIAGEQEFAVPTLSLPATDKSTATEQLAQSESVQLFLQRAQSGGVKLTLTADNAATIAAICLRLEGLPLAIELAAARCKLFTPSELLQRLERRLQFLTVGTRDRPQRQQTLRATLDWSHQLLSADEQLLFARLSVFVGGFTLESVEAVCNTTGDLPFVVEDGIAALLEQSLLRPMDEVTSERRFTMLETIREYASEQLQMRGEEAAFYEHHGHYFLQLAEEARLPLFTAQQQHWFQRLILEQGNFRAALTRWRESNNYAQVATLAAALSWFWWKHGDIGEEAHWGEWALAMCDRNQSVTSDAVRAKALLIAGIAPAWIGNFTRAVRMYEEYLQVVPESASFIDTYCVISDLASYVTGQGNLTKSLNLYEQNLPLSRDHNFKTGIANTLMEMGSTFLLQGEISKAEEALLESLVLRNEVGSITGIVGVQGWLGQVLREKGEFEKATEFLQQALESSQKLDDKQAIGWILSELGVVAQLQKEYSKAREYQMASLALERELNYQFVIAIVQLRLGLLVLEQEDTSTAEACFSESLEICERIEYYLYMPSILEGLAGVEARKGNVEKAAQLLGEGEAYRKKCGIARRIDERNIYEKTVRLVAPNRFG